MKRWLREVWYCHGGPLGVLAAFVAIAVVLIVVSNQRYERWLAECVKHEPQYRCELMWRNSQPDTVVVPVVVPSGGGR